SSSGTTKALCLSSRVWTILPLGDLNQSPSGTSLLASVGVRIPLSLRLNQAMGWLIEDYRFEIIDLRVGQSKITDRKSKISNLQFFLNTGGLTLAASHIVQFSTAYLADFQHVNLADAGRQDGKYPFYTHAVGDFADGKGFTVAPLATALDDNALKLLNTLLVPLPYLNVYVDGIACLEGRGVRTISPLFFLH